MYMDTAMFLIRGTGLEEAITRRFVVEEVFHRFGEPVPGAEWIGERIASFGLTEEQVNGMVKESVKAFSENTDVDLPDREVLRGIVEKKVDDILCNMIGTDFLS